MTRPVNEKDCPKCGGPMRWKNLEVDRCESCEGVPEQPAAKTVIDRLRPYAGKDRNQVVNPKLPPLDWEGYYTRKGGTRWFWCVVVAHDQGKAVVRTKTNNYHAHSPDEFEFSKEPEGYRV